MTHLANHQAKSSTRHRTGTLQQLTKYLDMELSEGVMTACHSGSVTTSD